MSVNNLLGLTLKRSELEMMSDIVAQLVFGKQVLPPGACVIKLITAVIYLDPMVKP